jgi:carbonic anhydrase 2
MATWGYGKDNGPKSWGKWYPVCDEGKRQSPIDICVESCTEDSKLPALVPKFKKLAGLSMDNTGASWKVNYVPDESSLTGGPLATEYKLVQMHAHWGSVDGRGSEHTINGKMYDGELHLVHYNTAYGSFQEAADKPDGLAVLGILLQVGDKSHEEFAKITSMLGNIKLKGDIVALAEPLDPANLIPGSDCYYTYLGSLTTPPLLESVTWLVYNNPINISHEQMLSMRSLQQGEEDGGPCTCMQDNYRPVCPTGDRTLRRVKI